MRNDTLRLLGDSKTNVPIEVPVTVDALQQQTRQTELLDKQTKLLQPDAWFGSASTSSKRRSGSSKKSNNRKRPSGKKWLVCKSYGQLAKVMMLFIGT